MDRFVSFSHTSFTQYFYRELWGGLHQHLGLYEDPGTVALPAQKRVVQVRLKTLQLLVPCGGSFI